MYVLLLLLITSFIFIWLYVLYTQTNRENYVDYGVGKGTGILLEADKESLKTYCETSGKNVKKYLESFVTENYGDEVTRIWNYYESEKHRDWIRQIPIWSLVITDGSIEYGYAFTMGHTMYLPIQYLKNQDDDTKKELFFHELRHIWQRSNYHGFIRGLDPYVWRGWRFRVEDDKQKAVNILRSHCKDTSLVINPDTFQVVAYAEKSKHPVYPKRANGGLEYIIRDHGEKIVWLDPHPCEWDARDMAQKILTKE